MINRQKIYLYLICSLMLLFLNNGFSQKSNKAELELKRKEIQKEIKLINELLSNNKKRKKAVYGDIETLNLKIQRKEELVKLTNQQINILNDEIKVNLKKQSELNEELLNVKKSYEEIILKSYKTKSGKSRLMFLLSSESFFQAYKRIQYIKQFAIFRKKQAIKISALLDKIKNINEELNTQKIQKESLLEINKSVKKSLEVEKNQSNILVFDLRKKEKKYIKEIADKQKISSQIDKEIERLIREAIEKSNKKKNNSVTFNLTPEAMELSKNFVLNKGKLPWPVIRGVVVQRFGTQAHPVVKTAKIKSNGIVIATASKEKVRTVFEGVVQGIMTPKNGNNTIMIRHGNYITVYKNLSKFYVSKGDKVTTKQIIGEVITNKVTGESILSFGIYKDSSIQNPSSWIYKL